MEKDKQNNIYNIEDKSLNEIISPHSEISAKLRQFFSHIEQEELPSKYLDLLEKLEEAEKKQTN